MKCRPSVSQPLSGYPRDGLSLVQILHFITDSIHFLDLPFTSKFILHKPLSQSTGVIHQRETFTRTDHTGNGHILVATPGTEELSPTLGAQFKCYQVIFCYSSHLQTALNKN